MKSWFQMQSCKQMASHVHLKVHSMWAHQPRQHLLRTALPAQVCQLGRAFLRLLPLPSSLPFMSQPQSHGYPSDMNRAKQTNSPMPVQRTLRLQQGGGPGPSRSQDGGFPCWGQRVPTKEGRGSLSGWNKFAKWVVCNTRRLRISYIPTYGSAGKSYLAVEKPVRP